MNPRYSRLLDAGLLGVLWWCAFEWLAAPRLSPWWVPLLIGGVVVWWYAVLVCEWWLDGLGFERR